MNGFKHASGPIRTFVASAAALAAASAASAATFAGGSWTTSDNGLVVVKANGAFEIVINDEAEKKSIYSSGSVAGTRSLPDGSTEATLKPMAKGPIDSFVLVVAPDGSAVLYTVVNGARRQAATLTR